MATTYQIFADFPDHRVTGRCIYSISDLLTISLLTYLCGGEDYVDMSEFAHVRARDFDLLTGNDTSPSPDTFERLMSAVCPEELRRCLSEHGRSFLSSLDEKQVAYYAMLARGHWGMENQLHWHLDVTFKEDACRARKGFAAQNLSTVRKLALQIVKAHSDKRSIRKRLFRASLSQDYLLELLWGAKI